jgi:catechol 2,3-dioxygenase-like lactoylglutathione lyase family enzyme
MGVRYLHTMVRVKDLEKSIAFYELLGLRETRRWDSEGAASRWSSWRPRGRRTARWN